MADALGPEVIGRGDDDRPPRRLGSVLTGVAAVALLGVGVAAALRTPEESPAARPTPTPSPSLSLPTSGSGWTEYPPVDPFESYVSAVRPGAGKSSALLLSGGIPVALFDNGAEVTAYEMLGGPSYAPVLLGLCAADGTLVAQAEGYTYYDGLPPSPVLPPLRRYPTRTSADPGHVEIALEPERAALPGGTVQVDGTCDDGELEYPALPERVDDLRAAGTAFALMRGRYVVTTETRAFCPVSADGDCRSAGWEEYGPHPVLPPWDRAGSYTWQGSFLVRANPRDGSLTVARTRDVRLVRRERVGASVLVGWAESSYERGGVLHLRFNSVRAADGTAEDRSPAGRPEAVLPWVGVFADERGGLTDLALAPDVEVHLARGVTGIGRPRGTAAVLRERLEVVKRYDDPPLWLVLDSRGRVIRVVEHPPQSP